MRRAPDEIILNGNLVSNVADQIDGLILDASVLRQDRHEALPGYRVLDLTRDGPHRQSRGEFDSECKSN